MHAHEPIREPQIVQRFAADFNTVNFADSPCKTILGTTFGKHDLGFGRVLQCGHLLTVECSLLSSFKLRPGLQWKEKHEEVNILAVFHRWYI
jgi:hypothetical protein